MSGGEGHGGCEQERRQRVQAMQATAAERLQQLGVGRVELEGLRSSLRQAWRSTAPGVERDRVELEGRGVGVVLAALDGGGADVGELHHGLSRLRELVFGLKTAHELGVDAPRCGSCGEALLLLRRGRVGQVVVRCARCRVLLERQAAGTADLLICLGEDDDPGVVEVPA